MDNIVAQSALPIVPMQRSSPNIPLLARTVLMKHRQLGRFPIDVLAITKAEKIHVIKNSMIGELLPGEYGKILYNLSTDQWIIVYDDTQPTDVSRFTIAHELGHYFLKHKDSFGSDRNGRNIEAEADLFATCLLMKGASK